MRMELLLFAALVVVGTFLVVVWYRGRVDRLVQEWARSRGVTVIRRNRTWLRVGPLRPVDTSQTVRYLTVRDASGVERKVWLLLGSWSLGVVDSEVDEVWE